MDLAKEQGVSLAAQDEEGLARSIHMGEICDDLVDYLKAFGVTLSVLQEDWALERVAYELIADAHADGVRYLEIRYCPVLHLDKGMRDTQVVEAVLSGMGAGRVALIRSGHLWFAYRPITSIRLARLAAVKDRGVIDFDGGCQLDHSKDHEAFYLIRNNNIPHASCWRSRWRSKHLQAIRYQGTSIGHGVRLVEDEAFSTTSDRRIPVEICRKSTYRHEPSTMSANIHCDSTTTQGYVSLSVQITDDHDTTVTDELFSQPPPWV